VTDTATGVVGQDAELHRYPVKSMQGTSVDRIDVRPDGVVGDRRYGLIDVGSGALLSAKRIARLLGAVVDDAEVTLPDGTRIELAGSSAGAEAALSAWLGRDVRIAETTADTAVAYEMTFDPPNDDAEYYAIDAPAGSFLDLAAVHLLCRGTLDWCAAQRPDLDWDVRRFRPNVVIDAPGLDAFGEDGWVGRQVHLGSVVLAADQATVRCAMPLRAQPSLADRPALASQPALYGALEELHANHLGLYLSVVEPGVVAVGDPVRIG
jgi:uncharacterized protein YcbX